MNARLEARRRAKRQDEEEASWRGERQDRAAATTAEPGAQDAEQRLRILRGLARLAILERKLDGFERAARAR